MADPSPREMSMPQPAAMRGLLFRPFRHIAGSNSLLIGLAAILLSGLVGSVSYSHFDGVLDFHTGRRAPMSLFLLEGLVDWLALAVVLFTAGKLLSRTAFRAIDLFGTQAMARWPMLIFAVVALAPPYQRFADSLGKQLTVAGGAFSIPVSELLIGGMVIVVGLLSMIWMVTLMYQSYSICCNVRGGRAIVSFVGGLIVAEALSKIILMRMLTG